MKKNWLVARGPTRLLRPGGSKINERINGRKLVRNSSAFVGVKTFAFLRGILNATPRLGIVLRSERLTRLDSVAGRKETEPLKRWRSIRRSIDRVRVEKRLNASWLEQHHDTSDAEQTVIEE